VESGGEPIVNLLEAREQPVNGVRLRARMELSERDTKQVIAATNKWVSQFDPKSKEDAHHLLEALWLHQQHNQVNRSLLTQLLHSPVPQAQIAAQRVEYLWKIDGLLATNEKRVVQEEAEEELTFAKLEGDSTIKSETLVVKIGTVMEKMRYDKTEFTVKAGQRVKLIFSNSDYMPHNLMIVKLGAAQEVVMQAIQLGADGFKMHFKPDSDKILVASKMLDYEDSETLEFTAPAIPGNYDYICTFPGHWPMMSGVMKVIPN